MDAPGADLNAYAGAPLLPSAIALACLSSAAVLLRFVSRRITRVPLLLDDWLILVALPFSLLECAIDIEGNYFNHFGRHIETASPEQVRMFFITTYIFQLSYGFAVTLPKFSMIALYRRVFGLENFRVPLIITTVACIAYLLGITFAAIFVCVPVNGFWDRTIPAKCVSLLPFYIGQASVNILLDLVLLAIPIIPIRRLNITSAQKIAVTGIFFLGIFVTVCSAIRLHALVVTTSAPAAALDPTFNFVGPAVWSVVETNLSVVCACLPSMRPLLRALVHGSFKAAAGRSEHSSHLGSSNRASGLVRTFSNRHATSDRPTPPSRTWSDRVAAVQRPAIQPRSWSTRSNPSDRAAKWLRANTGPKPANDLDAGLEKYPMTPLPPAAHGKRASLTSWRPNCPRARAAIDAIAGSSKETDASYGNSSTERPTSWRPLNPKARSNSTTLDPEFPQRRDSVVVQSSTARGGHFGEENDGRMGYCYEIRGGRNDEENSDGSDMELKDAEHGAGEWDRAKRSGRNVSVRSLGRQVWDDWSRRPSRSE